MPFVGARSDVDASFEIAPLAQAPEAGTTKRARREERDPSSLSDAEALAEVLACIREISPTEHVVERRGVRLVLERWEVLADAKMRPQTSPTTGAAEITIVGVRPDGVVGRLGVRNGDRLLRILGVPLSDPTRLEGTVAGGTG